MNNMLFNIKNFTTMATVQLSSMFYRRLYNNFELPTLSIIILKKGSYTRKQVAGTDESVRIGTGVCVYDHLSKHRSFF